MKIYILGPGSIGSLLGYSLHQLGLPSLSLTFLCKPSTTTTTINTSWQSTPMNYTLEPRVGDPVSFPVHRSTSIPTLSTASTFPFLKYLIVTTKAHQTEQALQPWVKFGCIHHDSHLLFIHNGMGAVESLTTSSSSSSLFSSSSFPSHWSIGITTHGAYRSSPFYTVHSGQGEWWFSPMLSSSTTLSPLLNLCSKLPNSHACSMEQMQLHRLKKLAINGIINPLTAYHQVPNGALISSLYSNVIQRLAKEIAQVYQAQFPFLPNEFHDPSCIQAWALQVCKSTKDNWSSMCLDCQHGSTTEIEFINGTLLKWAHQCQLHVPMNEWFYKKIKEKHP